MSYPEVCVAVDHHGPLDELVRTLQQVLSRNHTRVVDQQVHIAHLASHTLGCRVHALALPHVTHVCVDLRLERLHLLHTA